MKRSSIKVFASAFPYVEDVHRKDVQKWINQRLKDGSRVATVRRHLSEMRGYWAYLISLQIVEEDVLPLEKLTFPKEGSGGDEERQLFAPEDVVKMHKAAIEGEDQSLADLIELGMWTGARNESLCGLRVTDVDMKRWSFRVVDDKSAAGRRVVPIHSKLKKTMTRLVQDSSNGYVLSGLTVNKYGDRSNAVGKRFGSLKKRMGFSKAHVFHSIRKTIATLLENANVPENVAADFIGHDKPTMTYGLYSGGASLETKRKALERIKYPT
jgi:integrase